MPKCKICGQKVDSASVYHDECIGNLIDSVKCEMCDNYCRITHMNLSPADMEAACEHCPLDQLDKIGG